MVFSGKVWQADKGYLKLFLGNTLFTLTKGEQKTANGINPFAVFSHSVAAAF